MARKQIESPEEGTILKLTKTYRFEEGEVSELDFQWFDELTIDDFIRAQDALTRAGRVVALPEGDVQYCLALAPGATHMPIEFFDILGPRDITRVKNRMRNLFFSEG